MLDGDITDASVTQNGHPLNNTALKANLQLQKLQLTTEQAGKVFERMQKLQVDVDESNDLITELLGDQGPHLCCNRVKRLSW